MSALLSFSDTFTLLCPAPRAVIARRLPANADAAASASSVVGGNAHRAGMPLDRGDIGTDALPPRLLLLEHLRRLLELLLVSQTVSVAEESSSVVRY